MLDLQNVSKSFGGILAVDNVSFSVNKGEIVGLIGPNGAGKTTLFNCICGADKLTSGVVNFNGKKISGMKAHEIARIGIGRTFQIPRPIGELSVLDNVRVGSFCRKLPGVDPGEVVEHCLKIAGLKAEEETLAKNLTPHEKRRLELARALSLSPQLLLLDETAAGLNPTEVLGIIDLIRNLRDKLGITILWVEHVMRAIMTAAERIVVIAEGKKIAEGSPKNVASDPKVIESYLGEKYVAR